MKFLCDVIVGDLVQRRARIDSRVGIVLGHDTTSEFYISILTDGHIEKWYMDNFQKCSPELTGQELN